MPPPPDTLGNDKSGSIIFGVRNSGVLGGRGPGGVIISGTYGVAILGVVG